jgi:ubiquinol oxidase
LRFCADTFFAKRYGHRAIVLETVAAVPGMVGGALQHLRSLRRLEDDGGLIRKLLDEAENERMHLMTFVQIARPTRFERWLILIGQGVFYNFFFLMYLISPKTAHRVFYNFFFLMYLISPKTAHRVVGYFEEEAVISYSHYLEEIDSGGHENVPAPQVAIDYWNLEPEALLRDVVLAIRDDEAAHRSVNHEIADMLAAPTQTSGKGAGVT